MANYGIVRAYASSNQSNSATAVATFQVDFNVSSATILDIGYHYDVVTIENYPGIASYKFGIATTSTVNNITDAGGSAWTYLALGNTENIGDGAYHDYCPEYTGLQPAGKCSGAHNQNGLLHVPFKAGPNSLTVYLQAATSFNGTSDAYHTGQILGITVPSGVTFTYTDLAGNPLNVQSANAVGGTAPEPGTWGMTLSAAALVLTGLRRRRPRS